MHSRMIMQRTHASDGLRDIQTIPLIVPQEMQFVKVQYIHTPWYDDHFDLSQETLLLGKTFVAVTRGEASTLDLSYQLMGLALYEKFAEGLNLLETLAAGKDPGSVAKSAVSKSPN